MNDLPMEIRTPGPPENRERKSEGIANAFYLSIVGNPYGLSSARIPSIRKRLKECNLARLGILTSNKADLFD